jgi:lactate permease
LVALLVLLAVLRWKAPQAGPVGLFIGALIATTLFATPLSTLAVAVGKGVWDAIPILYVVLPALLLYRVGTAAGAFTAIRQGIQRFSRNELFLVLGFGWVFSSFLQGIAGFGSPIAVTAPLLLAIGLKPLYAVVIPLIGHAWANMFGTLAVGWLATLQVVELENRTTTAAYTAILLWIPNLAAGFTIAYLFGKWAAVKAAVPMVLVISLIHGGGQLALVFLDPVLSTFLAATAALIALIPLSRWSRYSDRDESIEDRPAMEEGSAEQDEDTAEAPMDLKWALLPYGALTVVAVLGLVVPPVERALSALELNIPFPEVTTGFGVTNESEAYGGFTPLTHPGTYLLVATLIAAMVYKKRGAFAQWRERADEDTSARGVLGSTASDAIPSSVAIVSFLVLAKILDHSGQTDVLALGIAEVSPAPIFAFLSVFIGVIGAFMTSSNTASNILFAPLQDTVAETEGLSQSAIIAAQSTGGAIGNAIAPANIVLGTTTAGIQGQEGAVLRRTLPWAGAVAVLTGLATIPFAL